MKNKLLNSQLASIHHPIKTELKALKEAALELEKLLAAKGITEEELISEYHSVRKQKINSTAEYCSLPLTN